MALQALIFDVDGTLADTERDGHRVAFNAAFEELGLRWHWDEELYGELLAVTGGKERILHFAMHHDPGFLRHSGTEDRVAALHAAKTRHYLAMLEAGDIALRPGVADLISEARAQGVRLAIATTTTFDNVITLLRKGLGEGAESWFEVIGAGDVVANKKPAPDIYFWVLERLGLPASECLAIEDSANGLASALGAGIPTLICEAEYTCGEDFTGTLAVVPGLAGIHLGRLRELHARFDTHSVIT